MSFLRFTFLILWQALPWSTIFDVSRVGSEFITSSYKISVSNKAKRNKNSTFDGLPQNFRRYVLEICKAPDNSTFTLCADITLHKPHEILQLYVGIC